MKRLALRITLVAGASAAVWSISPGAFAQTCRSGPEACKPNRKALTCAVDVALEDKDGRCTVSRLDKMTEGLTRHQVQACVGDTITWTFDNKCGNDVSVEIGNFRLDDEIIARNIKTNPKIASEEGDEVPLAGLQRMPVGRGRPGKVTGVAKAKYAPRTYKYDIIQASPGRRRVLLDPEVELYH